MYLAGLRVCDGGYIKKEHNEILKNEYIIRIESKV